MRVKWVNENGKTENVMSHQWSYKEKVTEKREREEASDGRNKKRKINTCPKPVNTW